MVIFFFSHKNPTFLCIRAHYFVAAPVKRARIRLLIKYLRANPKFDIVCLQEVFVVNLLLFAVFDEVQLLIKEMAKLGYHYHSDCWQSVGWKLQNS